MNYLNALAWLAAIGRHISSAQLANHRDAPVLCAWRLLSTQQDLISMNLSLKETIDMAQNRPQPACFPAILPAPSMVIDLQKLMSRPQLRCDFMTFSHKSSPVTFSHGTNSNKRSTGLLSFTYRMTIPSCSQLLRHTGIRNMDQSFVRWLVALLHPGYILSCTTTNHSGTFSKCM